MVWSLTQSRMDVWTDGWTDLWWVSLLFWCLFPKRRKWRGGSSSASVCLSREGMRGIWRVQHWQRTAEWAVFIHTSYTQPLSWKQPRRGRHCKLQPPISTWTQRLRTEVQELYQKSESSGNRWRHWHIWKNLLHRHSEHVHASLQNELMITHHVSVSLSIMTTFYDLWLHSTRGLFIKFAVKSFY